MKESNHERCTEYGCETCQPDDKEIDLAYVRNIPRVVHQGVYRLYENPDGGLRVQYKRDDREEEDFFEIPAAFQRLAKLGQEGKLSAGQMMREVITLMRAG